MRWSHCLLLIAIPLTCAAERLELPLDEAVAHAVATAPEVTAGAEAAGATRDLAVSAGRLPDPAFIFGIDNVPVEGPDAWSTSADFMTMTNFGLMQEFPGREKRRLEREHALAETGVADAELSDTRLLVARETARAWIRSATIESALDALNRLRPDVELGATAARAGVRAGRASTAEALAAESAVVLGPLGPGRWLVRFDGKLDGRPTARWGAVAIALDEELAWQAFAPLPEGTRQIVYAGKPAQFVLRFENRVELWDARAMARKKVLLERFDAYRILVQDGDLFAIRRKDILVFERLL